MTTFWFNNITHFWIINLSEKREAIHTPFNGFQGGLVVLLNPMVQKVQYSSLHTSGVKVICYSYICFFLSIIIWKQVFIHSPYDFPRPGSIYKLVSAGSQTYIQITASKIVCSDDIQRLSMEQRQCVYPEEVKLKYFHQYADTNCLAECEEQYFFRKCGCVPFYYTFTGNKSQGNSYFFS